MEYQIERRRYMSNIACEMLPGGGFIMRRAEECSEADRAKNFYCIHCRVRVYLHLPEAGRGISPYFSADSEPHKKECPNYREDLFRTVTHLDHTGSGVDLSELMKGSARSTTALARRVAKANQAARYRASKKVLRRKLTAPSAGKPVLQRLSSSCTGSSRTHLSPSMRDTMPKN